MLAAQPVFVNNAPILPHPTSAAKEKFVLLATCRNPLLDCAQPSLSPLLSISPRHLCAAQDWAVVKSWPDVSKKGVLSVAWSPLAGSLLVGGGDHNLRVFAPAGEAMQE